MTQPVQSKMSVIKIAMLATALMVVAMGFLGSVLFFVSLRVVEPSDDGTFSVQVSDGSKWSLATRNASSETAVALSVGGIRAAVNGVAVEFQDDRSLEVLVDTPTEQTVYKSVMTAKMPADGKLVVDISDNSGQYVLVKNDTALFFSLLVPGILFMILAFAFFAFAAFMMMKQNLKTGFGLIR